MRPLPTVLALVHTFTLGWITGSIMGVMTRYVPSLTKRNLFPRLARAFVFFSLNLGLLMLAARLPAGEAWIASAAATVFAIGGLRYALASAQTLSFAWRRRSPS